MEPCSLSSSIQSKPRLPSISTTWGEGKVHMTPKAGWPARSFCLRVLVRMAYSSSLMPVSLTRFFQMSNCGAMYFLNSSAVLPTATK